MEYEDSDMLDDAIQYPQDLSTDVPIKHARDVVDQSDLDHNLSSSPMSLREEYIHAPGHVYRGVDDDSTSRLDDLVDFEMLPGAVDSWQTVISEDTTAPIQDVTTSLPEPSNPRDRAVAQIESVFENIADALLAERSELAITLTAHRQLDPSNSIGNPQRSGRTRSTTVNFPGKSAEEAWRFSQSKRRQISCGY